MRYDGPSGAERKPADCQCNCKVSLQRPEMLGVDSHLWGRAGELSREVAVNLQHPELARALHHLPDVLGKRRIEQQGNQPRLDHEPDGYKQ